MSVDIVFLEEDENTDIYFNVGKRAKIRNQYNQAPHLTQDSNGKNARKATLFPCVPYCSDIDLGTDILSSLALMGTVSICNTHPLSEKFTAEPCYLFF